MAADGSARPISTMMATMHWPFRWMLLNIFMLVMSCKSQATSTD